MLKLALLISSLNTTVTIQFCWLFFSRYVFFFFHCGRCVRVATLCSSLFSTIKIFSLQPLFCLSHTLLKVHSLCVFNTVFNRPNTHTCTYICERDIHKPYVLMCALLYTYMYVCLDLYVMYYILSYVSMFYKFIWCKYYFELALHTFVWFPIAKLSLETRETHQDRRR